MISSNRINDLRTSLESYALLYVEDNIGLNTQATELFEKFFVNVYSAHDGEEGLALFIKHRPQIVITGITMSKLDGLSMAEKIAQIDDNVKIIITTSHDDQKYLHRSIRIGIFDYLLKPIKLDNITDTLSRCAKVLNDDLNQNIVNNNLNTIFDYQNNQVMLLHDHNLVIANQSSLDFFDVPNVDKFQNKFLRFGELLLEHKGFLYNNGNIEWLEYITENPGKLFNVKIADRTGNSHHFILNYKKIPQKKGYAVLSLNDVSGLDLLKLYDVDATERERMVHDKKGSKRLLEMAVRNAATISVHNLYKGLSITNDGVITEGDNKEFLLHVSIVQLKAMQYEKEFYLTSELFPMAIYCYGIKRISFDTQYVAFEHYKLVDTSPIYRDAIRIEPDDHTSATLFYEDRKLES
ncbi:MAG TPA: response regulator, partial [Sulfuricurvum sp.]|nr:response regulator [Sulfuricurvum sp.]